MTGTYTDPRRLYASPDRHYHNWNHIRYCLDLLLDISDRIPIAWYTPLRWALVYHDAVYDTHSKDSEARSAATAALNLRLEGVDQGVVNEVVRLIFLTKEHNPADNDEIGQIMCDIDCAILGETIPNYDEYVEGVRMEYGWVSDKDWKAGRTVVLQNFLARPRIFRSEYFTHLEQLARDNIERELEDLHG